MTELTGRSVKMQWTAPYSGNSPITRYVVFYRKVSLLPDGRKAPATHESSHMMLGGESQAWNNFSLPGSESVATIKNLRPVTRYEFQIAAINSLGKSEASEVIDFLTEEEGKLPANRARVCIIN